MHGALLVNKHPGVSSFGIIELLQKQLSEQNGLKRKEMPKLGHGGTLDPFASGLLAVCVNRAVKLARYFLGSVKSYEGVIRLGETTIPGDPTAPISETSNFFPESFEVIREMARKLTLQPYLQIPPMHSAKKKEGRPLYELARQGLEVEREHKICHLYQFEILEYTKPSIRFRLVCSSGTYVRTLAQDFAKLLGTVGMLEALHRTSSGTFSSDRAWSVEKIAEAGRAGRRWDQLSCWVPFDRLLDSYDRAHATQEEVRSLSEGRQNVLFNILKRVESSPVSLNSPVSTQYRSHVAIYSSNLLVAVAKHEEGRWGIERVFNRG